jgi:hypothetical protein
MAQSNPKSILLRQQAIELAAAQRSGKTGIKLLDDADNNIGNGTILQPQFLPLAGPPYVKQPNQTRARLLNLTASSRYGQSITVVMTAARVLLPGQALTQTHVGPITGIIEFGNGSQFTKVEFDIPVGPFQGSEYFGLNTAYEFQDGGIAIQVPTGTLRVFARYDNALVTPIQELNSPVFGEPPYPIPAGSGPFAPNPVLNDPLGPFPTRTCVPVLVKAFADYFGRIFSRLQKTLYLYISDPSTGGRVTFGPVSYAIPPFARAVRVVRDPQTAAMTLSLDDGMAFPNTAGALNFTRFIEAHAIPSGPAPLIPIEGYHRTISVGSATNGVGDRINGVKLVFDIGF